MQEPRRFWTDHPVRVPEKAFLSLAEVAGLVGVREKVVREWERTAYQGFPKAEFIAGKLRVENVAVGLWLAYRRYYRPPAPDAPGSDLAARADEAVADAEELERRSAEVRDSSREARRRKPT